MSKKYNVTVSEISTVSVELSIVSVEADHYFIDRETSNNVLVFMAGDSDTPVAMFQSWLFVKEVE